MDTTDKSIPAENTAEDTSVADNLGDTSAPAEPSSPASEPESGFNAADVTGNYDENNGLIFGKFKSMEEAHKSYKEAERAITKSAELEKQLRLYQQQSEKYEQDAIARSHGFGDRLEMALDYDVRQKELDNYALAAKYVLTPQAQLDAAQLINKCRANASKENISRLRRFFSPEIVALASEDTAMFKNSRRSEYESLREQDKKLRFNNKMGEFIHANREWVDSPLKSELISQAMLATDGAIDLPVLKGFVDAIEQQAVQKYQANTIKQQENAFAQASLQEPASTNARAKPKKWLTKKEYNSLSPAQEKEKYDLIVEQIELEKQGVLPRMLTK